MNTRQRRRPILGMRKVRRRRLFGLGSQWQSQIHELCENMRHQNIIHHVHHVEPVENFEEIERKADEEQGYFAPDYPEIKEIVKKVIDKPEIKTHRFFNECVICAEKFTEDDEVKDLPCKHLFHPSCIDKWLEKKKECPICKLKL